MRKVISKIVVDYAENDVIAPNAPAVRGDAGDDNVQLMPLKNAVRWESSPPISV
jgi:hypothetical protein